MRLVCILIGTLGGIGGGALLGAGIALLVMPYFSAGRADGTYGMREMLVCLPLGALVGLAAGLYWGTRTHLFMP